MGTEVLELLPGMSLHNRLEWHRMIGDSYELVGEYSSAEAWYKKLTEEHSDWAWGYVSWGDMYAFREEADPARAASIYLAGLERCRDDRDVLEERMAHLKG